jgi:hypothetical protein
MLARLMAALRAEAAVISLREAVVAEVVVA